jgi:HD-like signal output (HDOD) protein
MVEQDQTSAMEDQGLDRIAQEIGIPPCPGVLARYSAEMQQDVPDLRKLGALIGADIALSAALLKVVNSPFYGLRTRATTAHQALSIIGLRAGANLISGLIFRQVFPTGDDALMDLFWDKAAAQSSAATLAARRLSGIDVSEALTYALFRDCGIPVMIKKFHDYASIWERLEHMPGSEVTVIEDMRYRYSHARVGYALARGWLLPEPFCRAILYHHEFEKVANGRREVEPADRRLIAFGLLLEQIAALRRGEGLCPDWPQGEQLVLKTFDLTPEEIITLAQETEHESE